MKRTIPILITSVVGFVLIVAYFVPPIGPFDIPAVGAVAVTPQTWGETVNIWFSVLAAAAFVLGAANIVKIHFGKVARQQAGWGYSAVTLIAFFVTLIIGLFKIGAFPSVEYPNHPWAGKYDEDGTPSWFIYEYGMKPLMATTFALLAFFVTSAAFRAFRAKNLEATLLLGTAFVILLGRTYAGTLLTSWIPSESLFAQLKLENLSVTIMQVFTTAGNRAIMIGIALGVVATSLKLILGMDRSHLGADGGS